MKYYEMEDHSAYCNDAYNEIIFNAVQNMTNTISGHQNTIMGDEARDIITTLNKYANEICDLAEMHVKNGDDHDGFVERCFGSIKSMSVIVNFDYNSTERHYLRIIAEWINNVDYRSVDLAEHYSSSINGFDVYHPYLEFFMQFDFTDYSLRDICYPVKIKAIMNDVADVVIYRYHSYITLGGTRPGNNMQKLTEYFYDDLPAEYQLGIIL